MSRPLDRAAEALGKRPGFGQTRGTEQRIVRIVAEALFADEEELARVIFGVAFGLSDQVDFAEELATATVVELREAILGDR